MDLHFSLADSEVESYFYSMNSNKLILRLRLWNESIVEFSFIDPVLHIDNFRNIISSMQEIREGSRLLEDALKSVYEVVPNIHPYKLYQFNGLDDLPSVQIICSQVEFQVL